MELARRIEPSARYNSSLVSKMFRREVIKQTTVLENDDSLRYIVETNDLLSLVLGLREIHERYDQRYRLVRYSPISISRALAKMPKGEPFLNELLGRVHHSKELLDACLNGAVEGRNGELCWRLRKMGASIDLIGDFEFWEVSPDHEFLLSVARAHSAWRCFCELELDDHDDFF